MYLRSFPPPPGYSEITVGAMSDTRTYLWRVDTKSADRHFISVFPQYPEIA